MANYRNEYEFRSGLLDALGVEHTEADAKNEERWRAKMLDGLEVEYNQNDVNQFDLFRAKLVEGVESKSEGGGSSDFSTAEISISALPGNQCSVTSPHIITTPFDMLVADPKNYSGGDTVTVALYKGKASISASVGMGTITVSGDIESMGGDYYLVTGDCTITIS